MLLHAYLSKIVIKIEILGKEILSETDLQKPSIRFSFSIYNTKEEIDYVIGVLKEFIID